MPFNATVYASVLGAAQIFPFGAFSPLSGEHVIAEGLGRVNTRRILSAKAFWARNKRGRYANAKRMRPPFTILNHDGEDFLFCLNLLGVLLDFECFAKKILTSTLTTEKIACDLNSTPLI